MRRACVDGLRTHLDLAPSPPVRAARRWLFLDAAQRAQELRSELVAAELRSLGRDASAADGLLVERWAYQVADLAESGLHVQLDIDHPRPDRSALPVYAADRRATGPDWEQKYCVARLHLAARHDPAPRPDDVARGERVPPRDAAHGPRGPEHVDRLAEGWLHAGAWVPGIAAVHAVVVTADRRIVLARRHAATPYSPGTWSATFEEQLTATDIRAADAAARGRVPRRGGGAGQWGLGGVDGELTDIDAIGDHLSNRDPATLHPTSALRLRIVRRWLRRSMH